MTSEVPMFDSPIKPPADYPERARFVSIGDYERSLRGHAHIQAIRDRLNGPAVHVRLGNPRSRLVGAFACALSAFVVIYFSVQFLRWAF